MSMTRGAKTLTVIATIVAVAAVAAVIGVNALLGAKGRQAEADRAAAQARTEEQARGFATAVVRSGEAEPDRDSLAVAAEAGPVTVVTVATAPLTVTVRSETTFRVLFGVERVQRCYAVRFEALSTRDARYSMSIVDSCPP